MTETPDEFVKRTMRSKIVVVDEWGNDGLKVTEKEPVFVMGGTFIDKPEEMMDIAKDLRKNSRSEKNREELKYRNLYPDEREPAELRVANTGVKIEGVYIDKRLNDNPLWWLRKNKNRSEEHLEVLSQFTEEILRDPARDNLTVILDEHSAYKENRGIEEVEKVVNRLKKKSITVIQEHSDDQKRFGDLMQSADIAIGAAGHALRGRERVEVITMKLRRLKE